MAKLGGRYLSIDLDDSGGNVRAFEGDVDSVDIPIEYDELDITGFSDGSKNSIPGMPGFNVEISGTFNPTANTGIFALLNDIVGDYSGHTLTIAIGLNTAPTSTDPEFEGEFWCPKIQITGTPTGKMVITASLRVYGGTAPLWGAVA